MSQKLFFFLISVLRRFGGGGATARQVPPFGRPLSTRNKLENLNIIRRQVSVICMPGKWCKNSSDITFIAL